jgi:hypothetical protein
MKKYEPAIPCFNPIGHLYHDAAGQALDSVTTILKAELKLYNYGSQDAANRGTEVHKACQFHDEKDLIEADLPDEVAPFFKQYKLALKAHNIKVHFNELRRYSRKYLFAGCIDKIISINGEHGILDIKTSKTLTVSTWWRWQTAAYTDMMKDEAIALGLPLTKRWALVLSPEKFRLVEHDGKRDFFEFLALQAAHTIKCNTGYRKRKIEQPN